MTELNPPPGSTIDNPIMNEDVGCDEMLQALVATADSSRELSVGMTLAANGCVVTGLLIGERRWFTELETEYPDLRPSFTTPLRKRMVDDEEGQEIVDERRFVHLKDARYLTGGGFAPNVRSTGFFWRGRLAHISAWSFGVVGPNQA